MQWQHTNKSCQGLQQHWQACKKYNKVYTIRYHTVHCDKQNRNKNRNSRSCRMQCKTTKISYSFTINSKALLLAPDPTQLNSTQLNSTDGWVKLLECLERYEQDLTRMWRNEDRERPAGRFHRVDNGDVVVGSHSAQLLSLSFVQPISLPVRQQKLKKLNTLFGHLTERFCDDRTC